MQSLRMIVLLLICHSLSISLTCLTIALLICWRGEAKDGNPAFREAFGRLEELRSLTKEGMYVKTVWKITSEGGNTKSLCDRINLSNEQLRNNSHNEPKLSNLPTKKSRCTLQGELGSRFLVVLVLMSENRPYHEFKKPITLRSNKSMNLWSPLKQIRLYQLNVTQWSLPSPSPKVLQAPIWHTWLPFCRCFSLIWGIKPTKIWLKHLQKGSHVCQMGACKTFVEGLGRLHWIQYVLWVPALSPCQPRGVGPENVYVPCNIL